MRSLILTTITALLVTAPLMADGPADNKFDQVRPIPPVGIEIPADVRESLTAETRRLKAEIDKLKAQRPPIVQDLVPDVEIFWRAVDGALTHNEFSDPKEFDIARKLLAEGLSRAAALSRGEAPWAQQEGLVVRGYRSKLDDTVQPYGLWVPSGMNSRQRLRCDVWLHGRYEKQCELQFINMRMTQKGEITPPDTIVLHPYGRFSNAFKLAGEVDVNEALAHAQEHYRIDDNRIAIRGFSMGGAGVWHFTVHHPHRFFASNPGAGFSETPEFLKVFQKETLTPASWEQALWNLYDAPGWAGNLRMIPTVAYSGEIDSQKQAADVMAAACEKEGITLTHIIGPQTAHRIHPDSKVEIERRLALIARQSVETPRIVTYTTWTLKYDRCHWVRVLGLVEHWKAGRIDARLAGNGVIELQANANISELQLNFEAGQWPASEVAPREIRIGNQMIGDLPPLQTDRSWSLTLRRAGNNWTTKPAEASALRKVHGLQGPIDDALLDAFVFVKPTGTPLNAAVGQWTDGELKHAITHWRQQMRGDALVKSDSEITEADIASRNLILWGDPQSNALIAKVLPGLPITWDKDALTVNGVRYEAGSRVPALVYPNPLNPSRYVVLNSSFTYREYDYLNNARQTPKLPDWAVLDVRTPANSRFPAKIEAADFFDEAWKFKTR